MEDAGQGAWIPQWPVRSIKVRSRPSSPDLQLRNVNSLPTIVPPFPLSEYVSFSLECALLSSFYRAVKR